MRQPHKLVLSVLLSLVPASALFGQVDRGVITGIVADSSGAPIPEAMVTVTNEDTGVKTIVTTTSTGNYSTPPLIIGTYMVQVEKEGFQAYVRKGILLTSGSTYRQDVVAVVGKLTQTLEVTGASVIVNTENAQVSAEIGERYYHNIPVVVSGEERLPEALLYMQPGFIPNKPCPSFGANTQFESRMNGGEKAGTENYLDGASYGEVSGHNFTEERSVPFESVAEMKVLQGTFSAQYGRTSAGLVEYTTKSGTSALHGTAYEYLMNNVFNARGEFGSTVTPLIQNQYGFSVGGPVWIPKVYDGRNKTFFFTAFDGMDFRTGAPPNFNLTTPIDAFRQGDFSALLNTSAPIAMDALGRPVYNGEVFDPSTTRQVNGVPLRDGFGFDPVTGLPVPGQANVIPASDPLRSAIGAKYAALIPEPDRPGIIGNSVQHSCFKSFDPRTWFLRVDHSFSEKLRTSFTFNYTGRPGVEDCSVSAGGCDITKPIYVGTGFTADIRTRTAHEQFDWVIRPNLFNHTTVAYDRWFFTYTPLSLGVNKELGITGLQDNSGGAPGISLSSGIVPYSGLGTPLSTNGAQATGRWQVFDDLTWIKGKHNLRVGMEWRRHDLPYRALGAPTQGNFNFSNAETGGFDNQGNPLSVTGDPVASLLLGQVDNANFAIPDEPEWYQTYWAPWVNDEIKLTKKLTVNLGLRWDYQAAETEKYNRFSTFSPTTPNPGAGGLPGAMIFAGTGPGRAGVTTFQSPPKDGWGPRFGLAYSLMPTTVIRGGYGIMYGGINHDQFISNPDQGFSFNPTVPNVTNGLMPAFYWDDGFPQSAIKFPPIIDPTVANGQSPIYVTPDSLNLPRYQNWSVSVGQQISGNLALDVTYLGNRGTRLIASGTTEGVLDNMNNPEVLALGSSVLEQTDFSNPAVVAAGIKVPYQGFTGDVAQALRPYPQYQNIQYRNVPTGSSIYHALQVELQKRFSVGLQFRVAYTASKFITTAESALAGSFAASIQNPADVKASTRSLSLDDIPQMLIVAYTYELPFGPNKRFANAGGPLGKLTGGWTVSALQRYEKGRPLGITMANDMGGFLFNGRKFPNKVGAGLGKTSNFDPATDIYLLSSGWADPGPLNFGNATREDPQIRGFPYYTENVDLSKDTWLSGERLKLRFEAQANNVLNRHTYCDPNTNWSSSAFGQVFGQCNIPRQLQFALRLEF